MQTTLPQFGLTKIITNNGGYSMHFQDRWMSDIFNRVATGSSDGFQNTDNDNYFYTSYQRKNGILRPTSGVEFNVGNITVATLKVVSSILGAKMYFTVDEEKLDSIKPNSAKIFIDEIINYLDSRSIKYKIKN